MSPNSNYIDGKQVDYWNNVRIKKLSTDSNWMTEVYEDASMLIDLAKQPGVSDNVRESCTARAIDALEEIREFLKNPKE